MPQTGSIKFKVLIKIPSSSSSILLVYFPIVNSRRKKKWLREREQRPECKRFSNFFKLGSLKLPACCLIFYTTISTAYALCVNRGIVPSVNVILVKLFPTADSLENRETTQATKTTFFLPAEKKTSSNIIYTLIMEYCVCVV